MIYAVEQVPGRSTDPHLAQLRRIYIEKNDKRALVELDEYERQQASKRGSFVRLCAKCAPVAAVAFVVAVAAVTNNHHGLMDVAHKARFALAAAFPLIVKTVAARYLG